jgi:hypothetical protein
LNQVSSSSFEFYEGLRVLVPGSLAVGLFAAAARTFGLGDAITFEDAVIGVVATLAIGFVLLFVDVPARAAVFAHDAPAQFMRSWADLEPLPPGSNHLNVYYELLDAEFPPVLRDRINYLGVIFRIGFEMVYLAALAVPVLAVATLFPSVGDARQGDESALRWTFGVALVLHVAIVAGAIWSRKNERSWRRLGEDLAREVPAIDRVFLLGGFVALAYHLTTDARWAGVAAIALPGAVWTIRYYRGVPRRDPQGSANSERGHEPEAHVDASEEGEPPRPRYAARQNLHAASAAVTFGLAVVPLCAIGVARPDETSPLDAYVAAAWLAVSLVGAVLIAARGHERKLQGSYGTQRTWLARNRTKLVEDGYFAVRSDDATVR